MTRTFPSLGAPVLHGVDLELRPGTVTRLEGANGAGKTTLLRVAGGLLRPDTGHVRLGPYDPEAARVEFHRRVALLTATQVGLYARLRVRGHLDWWARVSGLERRTPSIGMPPSWSKVTEDPMTSAMRGMIVTLTPSDFARLMTLTVVSESASPGATTTRCTL